MREMTAKINREIASFCLQGNQEVNNGNQEKAISLFEKAYRKSRELDDDYRERVCAFNLGAAYLANGKAEEGLQYLNKARPPRDGKDFRSNGDLFYNIAYAYGLLKEFRKALEYYELASVEYKSERDNLEMERECLKQSVMIYEQHFKDHLKAAEIYGKLADLQEGDGVQEALSKCEQANHLRLGGKSDEAETIANKCFEKLESVMSGDSYRYSRDIGRLYNDLGLLFTQLTKYDRCLQCFEQALPCVRAVKDQQMEAVVLQNLGAAYNFVGDYQRAIKYLEDAATLFAEWRNRNSQGQCFANLGFAFSQLSRTEDAEEAFLHAKQAASDARDNHSLWQSLEGLGSVKCNQGKLDKAAEYFQEALGYVGKNREAGQRIREKLKHVIQLEVQLEAAAQRGMVPNMTLVPETGRRYPRIPEEPAMMSSQESTLDQAAPVVKQAMAQQVIGQKPGPETQAEVARRYLQMRKKDSFGPHHPKMARGLSGSFTYDSPRFRPYSGMYNGKDSSEASTDSASDSDSDSDSSGSSSSTGRDSPDKGGESPAVKEIFRRSAESPQRQASRQVTLRRDDGVKKYEQMLLEQDEEEQKHGGEGESSSSGSGSVSDSSEEEMEEEEEIHKKHVEAKVVSKPRPAVQAEESEESEDGSSESESEEEGNQTFPAPPPIPTQSPPATGPLGTYEALPGQGQPHSHLSVTFGRTPGQQQQQPPPPAAYSSVTATQKNAKPDSPSRDFDDTGHYDKLDYRRIGDPGAPNDPQQGGIQNLSRGQRERMLYDEHQRLKGQAAPALPEHPEKKKSRACVVM